MELAGYDQLPGRGAPSATVMLLVSQDAVRLAHQRRHTSGPSVLCRSFARTKRGGEARLNGNEGARRTLLEHLRVRHILLAYFNAACAATCSTNTMIKGCAMIEPFAADFNQDTAFELYVLSAATPIAVDASSVPSATLSLSGGTKHVQLSASVTFGMTVQGAVKELGLSPLLFGAAWKTLDLLADHIMSAGAPVARISIATKTAAARGGLLSFSPLSAYPDVLQRVWVAYANGEQYRHSLVHRRASVAANDDFIGVDSKGAPLRPMSAAEQTAFCRMTQWTASFVASGAVQKRAMLRLAAELDALTMLTNLSALGYPAPSASVPKVTIPVQSSDVVDMSYVRKLVYETFPSVTEVDVTFEVTDLQAVRYLCALEAAPDVTLTMDETTNVPWLQRL
jgi:hypothetical protein